MLARVLASLLCLVGAAAITLGAASATVWRGSDTLVASAQAADGSTLVVTEPGVLATAADQVRIEATAGPDDTVVLAMGRTLDVEAWVGSDAHTVVTGLADWTTLAVRDVAPTGADDEAPDDAATDDAATDDAATDDAATDDAATDDPATDDAATDDTAADDAVDAPTPASAPDPAGSDLWIEETTGARTAAMDWNRTDGRWSLLVVSTGESPTPPTLTLTWPREVTTPWFWPGVAGGAFLLLAGVAWWVLLIVTARRSAMAAEASGRHGLGPRAPGAGSAVEGAPVTAPATQGGTTAPVPSSGPAGPPAEAPLTRRQLRELEQQRRRPARGSAAPSSDASASSPQDAAPSPGRTAPSPDDTPSTGSGGPSAPSVTDQAPPVAAPNQPVGREWSPAWRATVVGGAPERSAGEHRSPGPEDTRHTGAPHAQESSAAVRSESGPDAGAPSTGRPSTGTPEADGDRGTGRPQRWGERIVEHVPHLSRRARRTQQESTGPDTMTPPVGTPPPGTGSAAAPPTPAGSGAGTTSPASPAGSDPSRPHETRSASADAWRRAWGFPAAGESPDPGRSTDGPDQSGSPSPGAEEAGTDGDGGRR